MTNFRVASTPRKFDSQTNQWVDGEALFLQCNVWRQPAENVANSITKGARVIVTGRLRQRSYENQQGEKRTVFEVEVDEVGPSLRYATTQITKTPSQGGNFGTQPQQQNTSAWAGATSPADAVARQAAANQAQGGYQPQQQMPQQQAPQQQNAWNTQQPQQQQFPQGDQPPF